MSHRGEETIYTNVGLILPAVVLFLFLRFVAWVWVAAALVMSLFLIAAVVVRSVFLPYIKSRPVPVRYQIAQTGKEHTRSTIIYRPDRAGLAEKPARKRTLAEQRTP
jgi:hypothetical protein